MKLKCPKCRCLIDVSPPALPKGTYTLCPLCDSVVGNPLKCEQCGGNFLPRQNVLGTLPAYDSPKYRFCGRVCFRDAMPVLAANDPLAAERDGGKHG